MTASIETVRVLVETYATETTSELLEALKQATAIIREHLPIDALGIATDRGASWPLLAEYLHSFDAAIAKAEAAA